MRLDFNVTQKQNFAHTHTKKKQEQKSAKGNLLRQKEIRLTEIMRKEKSFVNAW